MERLDKFLCDCGIGTRSQVKLILKAGSTRRQGGNHYLVTYAGMEFSNARQIRLKVDNTFASESHDGAKPRLNGLTDDHLNFIGLVLDYSVNGKYPPIASSDYKVKSGDKIVFTYKRIAY